MSEKLLRTLGLGALILGIGRCLHFRAWRMAGGPEGEHWSKHWHPHHSHRHPWFAHWEKRAKEQTKPVEPDAQAEADQTTV